MKYIVITICLIGVVSGSLAWKSGYADIDDQNPWRNEARGLGVRSADDDPNSWRNQKKSLSLRKAELDVTKFPLYSYFEKKKDKEESQGGKGVRIAGIDNDIGVISCPPDIPKCIPRLGR